MKKMGFACDAALGVLVLSASSVSEANADAGVAGNAAGPPPFKPGLWEMTEQAPPIRRNIPDPQAGASSACSAKGQRWTLKQVQGDGIAWWAPGALS